MAINERQAMLVLEQAMSLINGGVEAFALLRTKEASEQDAQLLMDRMTGLAENCWQRTQSFLQVPETEPKPEPEPVEATTET